jgi:Ser/Thr protein kinase RdoA (MazF antagonist)
MLRLMLDCARIAEEFGLGPVLGVAPLAGGHPDVTRLTTPRGTFVVKPAYGMATAELYEQAARALSAAGIRQAQPLRTTAGSLASGSGHTVQEFLPGRIALRPTRTQTAATMRHVGAYHAALERVPVPSKLPVPETVWDRVASAEYLVNALPGLLRSHGPPGGAGQHDVISAALGQVELALPQMRQLPRQLVHGDVAPDNVLMHGSEVIAIIDFTPFFQPVLFAVATAVYWYYVHGQRRLDPVGIRASLTAAGHRPWTTAERQAWPAMLAREALRRLASPLALAAQTGTGPPARTGARYQAVLSVMVSWPELQASPQ